ncbi:spondin domain-containing protein [Pseudoduganella chitinolytica]|uniref:Spondin domain-containing protein n=1 Tax=Pseudoduganella chitinolytica TaxID=34070 RepID=A0ABY8BBJ4_9BURK|nr:spondin domain-containing protein [Pseudoduganella chitinolytica]WEF31744.1 spondin domain-containing protein [Pseudoduganella chitinolytica]
MPIASYTVRASTLAVAIATMVTIASPAQAQSSPEDKADVDRSGTLTVTVTNLTHGTWFAPILVAAHPAGFKAFTEGRPASVALQSIAEIGDIAPLAESLPTAASIALNPANGPLKPGGSATAHLQRGKGTHNSRLSVLAMLVPTNDGFIGLNAIEIPTQPGYYTYTLSAYDAGTEANDEARAAGPGIGQPGMGLPAFLNGVGIYSDAPGFANARVEGYVHVHRGILGGAAGADSVLEQTMYRWMNPVARVTLTVR